MTFVAGPHDPNAHDTLTACVLDLSAELARAREALSRVTAAAAGLASRLPDPGAEAQAAIYLARIELSRLDGAHRGPFAWTPIEAAPASIWDGREVLLWLRAPYGRPAILRWSAKYGCWLDGEWLEDGDELCGTGALVPSHAAEIVGPEADRALFPAELEDVEA